MDRLEPVLKQKFWILLGIGLILTITGWWMATSAMAKAISERSSSIDASFKSIPGGEIPNESWAKRLGAINTDQSNAIEATKLSMWKRQRDRMNWPEGITDPGYWGKFTNSQREMFRDSYGDEVRRVWKIVNPLSKSDGTGIVEYPVEQVFILLRQKPWDVAPPDSEVMWNVREDLWLLEGLFQTITSVNGGYDISRGDACIHQIDRLELRGGGDKVRDNSGGGGPGGGGPGGGPEMAAFGPGMMRGGGGGAGPGTITEGLKMVSAEFDAAEEFGDDGSSSGRGGGGGGKAGAMVSSMSMMEPGGNSSATPAADIKRYLPIDSNLPFKKRGFYLSVKMDHTKIPLLIAELTANEKSVWPIEILRVQMSRLNEDDSTGGRTGRTAPGMAGSSSISSAFPGSSVGFPTSGGSESDSSASSFSEFASTLKPGSSPDLSNTQHAQQMRVALENTLKDPVMAQVTICGTITLFKPVKEPEEKKPVPATPAATTDDAEAKKSTSEEATEKSESSTSETATEAAAEPMEPAENAAEMKAANESAPKTEPAAKPEPGEPKPEPGEPKPESGDK